MIGRDRCTRIVRNAVRNALTQCDSGQFRRCLMSFLDSTSLDDLARRLADPVPDSDRTFGRDLEGNFKAVLRAQLSNLDVVSGHEFDVQAALLARPQAM